MLMHSYHAYNLIYDVAISTDNLLNLFYFLKKKKIMCLIHTGRYITCDVTDSDGSILSKCMNHPYSFRIVHLHQILC